ncbi:MAG: tetratricopeptide repeat protein [Chloroflexi bacterium]|nr:tetratricopeptide repeat protein [Chloroflexota bacterium]
MAPVPTILPQSVEPLDAADEDAKSEQYLTLLQHGSRAEKVVARERLGRLFERRGMFDEAAELYERNILAGVRDPNLYVRLASVYRRQGREDLSAEVLQEAARLPAESRSDGVEPALRPLPGAGSPPPRYESLMAPPPRPAWERATRTLVGTAMLLACVALLGAVVLVVRWAVFDRRADAVQAPPAAAAPTATPAPPRCQLPDQLARFQAEVGVDVVGECVEASSLPESPEVRFRTTRGEVIQRAADSQPAFTDGAVTWLRGPSGIRSRLNGDRYSWEPREDPALASLLPRTRPDALLPRNRIVSYYGNTLASGMGVLGEGPPDQILARLQRQADVYAAADPSRPVIPAIQFITPVAQALPGADGMYRLRMDDALIEEVASWAEQRGYLLILDVQIGRSSVQAEIAPLLKYLERPYVQLALDPEFSMPPDEEPGQEIGTMDAAAINSAIDTLNDLVVEKRLPPKILVVHRFLDSMVTNYQDIRPNPRVQVVMDMDGFGNPATKIAKYDRHVGEQRVDFAGIKLFYNHDKPLMTPKDLLALDPPPDIVSYQ